MRSFLVQAATFLFETRSFLFEMRSFLFETRSFQLGARSFLFEMRSFLFQMCIAFGIQEKQSFPKESFLLQTTLFLFRVRSPHPIRIPTAHRGRMYQS
ncbi:MAG: hypothetical protein KME42_12040 [Tildeniella nuda ZEHNDER 1965/U140]|nr:hypothetical protein [Tildeniella nuda ZEHNDER 1965/U140]